MISIADLPSLQSTRLDCPSRIGLQKGEPVAATLLDLFDAAALRHEQELVIPGVEQRSTPTTAIARSGARSKARAGNALVQELVESLELPPPGRDRLLHADVPLFELPLDLNSLFVHDHLRGRILGLHEGVKS